MIMTYMISKIPLKPGISFGESTYPVNQKGVEEDTRRDNTRVLCIPLSKQDTGHGNYSEDGVPEVDFGRWFVVKVGKEGQQSWEKW